MNSGSLAIRILALLVVGAALHSTRVLAQGGKAPAASRVSVLRRGDTPVGISVLLDSADNRGSKDSKGVGSIRVFLPYEGAADQKKLGPFPSTKALSQLTIDVALHDSYKKMEENSGLSGKVTVTGPSAARLGYEFGRMADASGKLQPYLYGKIYSNGSAEPKSVATPIGAAAGWPLSYWGPSGEAKLDLLLQPETLFSRPGELLIWRCVGDKVVWVERISWPGSR